MKLTSLPTISMSEVPLVSPVPPILPGAELKVITSPTSPTLVVEPAHPKIVTSPTSVVASVLISMRTPPRSPTIPRVAAASAPTIPSMIMSIKTVKTLSSGAARLSKVIEAENEFVAELVDSFYKSLKRSIALILKGSTTSFSALKVVLSQSIDSIWDFGGDDQAAALELLVDRLERNVDEWRSLRHSDLESSVNEQLAHLAAQMHEAYLAAQEATKAISFYLKSLETRKVELGDVIDTSSSALLDAEDKIEKAKEMIRKANLLLSKAEPVRLEEAARLEQLKAQNDEVLWQELAQRATLVEVEARLAQTVRFNETELRSQALIRAAEDRKTKLAALERRIKSYEAPS